MISMASMTTTNVAVGRRYLAAALAVLAWTAGVGSATTAAQEPDRSERHRVPADFMSFRGAQWLERDERVRHQR